MVAPDTKGTDRQKPKLSPLVSAIKFTGPGDIDIDKENTLIAISTDIGVSL